MSMRSSKAPIAAPRRSQNLESTAGSSEDLTKLRHRAQLAAPDDECKAESPPLLPARSHRKNTPSPVNTVSDSTPPPLPPKPHLEAPDSGFEEQNQSIQSLQLLEKEIPPPLPDRPHKRQSALYENAALTHQERLRGIARKWNFGEEVIEKALERTHGQSPDTDIFLANLLAASSEDNSQNTGSSTKKATDDGESQLKKIVLDGSNIAMTHGNGTFSYKGIMFAVDWFRQRGHKNVKVVLPLSKKDGSAESPDQEILEKFEKVGVQVVYTPMVQRPNGNQLTCYDDRFILEIASEDKAVVVSNDKYRDLAMESIGYHDTISHRLLGFTFSEDRFMPPSDPMGKRGPTLDQFLRTHPNNSQSGQCPYGRRCTYGTRCRYSHPERKDSALPSTIPADLWRSQEIAKHDKELEKFQKRLLQEAQKQYQQKQAQQAGNNFPSYPMPQEPAFIAGFSNHPSNFNRSVSVQARCVATEHEPASSDSNLQSNAAGTIPLQVDTSYTHQPKRPMSQLHMSMPGGYAAQGNQPFQHSPFRPLSLQPGGPNGGQSLPMTQMPSSFDIGSMTNSEPSSVSVEMPPFLEPSDSRHNLYFHLTRLFPEQNVRLAMIKLPNETDPERICRMILGFQQ